MTREREDGSVLSGAETVAAYGTPNDSIVVGNGDVTDDDAGPRYREGALLGAGGMGEVRIAHDRRIGRDVAVKALRRDGGPIAAAARERFLREARVQGQLEHPSVVPVYDLEIEPDGEARIRMKRVHGVTLEAVLGALAAGDAATARRFPRRRLLTAFVSVCRAIDYAHARGVVHRDVKPSNIMLGDFGEVNLLDWGIAKVRSLPDPVVAGAPALAAADGLAATLDAGLSPRSDSSAPTAQGSLLGTPGYMAPEQARGENDRVDARADVFALGAVLFEILTLAPLVPGRTALERLDATLRLGDDRSPAHRAPAADVPPELDVAVVLATAPDRDHRTAGAGILAEAVDAFLDGDRDLALRRGLAEALVRDARTAAADAEEADGAEAGARAVGLLTRALALDPQHREAAEALERMLVEPPQSLPREAGIELAAARDKARRALSSAGIARLGAATAVTLLGALLGVRLPSLGAVIVVGLLVAGAASAAWLRAATERGRTALSLVAAVSSVTALTGLSFAFGPTIGVPAVAMLNGLLLLGQKDFRADRLVIGLSLVPVLWSFAASAAGLAAPPYDIAVDRILIPARLISFPPALTLPLLVLMSTVQVLVPLAIVAALRARLRRVEETLFLHSWHLRRWTSAAARG